MEYYAGILVCIFGALVLVWAFVRPRKGDEPHCRRCRFDLSGLAKPDVCPECGKPLFGERAVTRGHRPSPRRGVLWCVGLCLVGGGLIGLDSMNRSGFFNLTKHKPAFVLQSEAYLLGDLRASMATTEIEMRIRSGALGTEAQKRLVRTALARHAQTWRVFPNSQWMVLTCAMGRNELSFEQIQRVWEDCFHDARVLTFGREDPKYTPGESTMFSAGVQTRAGVLAPLGIGNVGFALDESIRIRLVDDAGQSEELAHMQVRGPIVQRTPGRTTKLTSEPKPDQKLDLRFEMPSSVGHYTGVLEFELDFAEEMVASNWPGISAEQLDRLGTLKKVYEFPFSIEVVHPDRIVVRVVDPESLGKDPGSLIRFDVAQIYTSAETKKDPGIMYRVGTRAVLDPAIGLGGHIYFTQGDRLVVAAANYSELHATTQHYTPLKGFLPGEVRVRYEYDVEVARRNRDKMTSALGGPIDLVTIVIPE